MKLSLNDIIKKWCRISYRHPYIILVLAIAITIPAFFQTQKIRLDTKLLRLLPKHSTASVLSKELEGVAREGEVLRSFLKIKQKRTLRRHSLKASPG